MATERITEAELVEALAQAVQGASPEDARTSRELMQEFGLSQHALDNALNILHSENRLVAHRIRRPARDGVMRPTVAYTILPASKRKRT